MSQEQHRAPPRARRTPAPRDLPQDTQVKKLTTAGPFMLGKVHYEVDGRRALEEVLVIPDGDKVAVTDFDGEILIEYTRPGPAVTYVGNGRPAARSPRSQKRHRSPETSHLRLTGNCRWSHVCSSHGAGVDR